MQRRITSGCSSQRSSASEKKETPSFEAVFVWSDREWARTVWPWRTRALARNWPKLPKPIMAILSLVDLWKRSEIWDS